MFISPLVVVWKPELCNERCAPTMLPQPPQSAPASSDLCGRSLLARARLVGAWRGGFTSLPLVEQGQMLVGRGLGVDLRLNEGSVSREHAILISGDPPCIIDADSANGVYMDGLRIRPGEPVPLLPGSIGELGGAFLLLIPGIGERASPASGRSSPASVAPSSREERLTFIEQLESSVERTRRLELPSARLVRVADAVATSTASVLLLGESGVGKAELAKRMHRRSSRERSAFLAIDCATLGGTPEAGEWTRLLGEAWTGSVLLENVDRLNLEEQGKLLNALGEGSALRPGFDSERACSARLFASSRADLRERVEAGSFRADLYLRLANVSLNLPPLRERRAELLPLAHQFLVEAGERAKLPVPGLDEDARQFLWTHAWPGNLLELRSTLSGALEHTRGRTISAEHLVAAQSRHTAPTTKPAVVLRDEMPEPERPTNPFASSAPLTQPKHR